MVLTTFVSINSSDTGLLPVITSSATVRLQDNQAIKRGKSNQFLGFDPKVDQTTLVPNQIGGIVLDLIKLDYWGDFKALFFCRIGNGDGSPVTHLDRVIPEKSARLLGSLIEPIRTLLWSIMCQGVGAHLIFVDYPVQNKGFWVVIHPISDAQRELVKTLDQEPPSDVLSAAMNLTAGLIYACHWTKVNTQAGNVTRDVIFESFVTPHIDVLDVCKGELAERYADLIQKTFVT